MEGHRPPARKPLERLEVVALPRHRFQQSPAPGTTARAGARSPRPSAGTSGRRAARRIRRPGRSAPARAPARPRERGRPVMRRRSASSRIGSWRGAAGKPPSTSPGTMVSGKSIPRAVAQLAHEHPARHQLRTGGRRRGQRGLEQGPELLERHDRVHRGQARGGGRARRAPARPPATSRPGGGTSA